MSATSEVSETIKKRHQQSNADTGTIVAVCSLENIRTINNLPIDEDTLTVASHRKLWRQISYYDNKRKDIAVIVSVTEDVNFVEFFDKPSAGEWDESRFSTLLKEYGLNAEEIEKLQQQDIDIELQNETFSTDISNGRDDENEKEQLSVETEIGGVILASCSFIAFLLYSNALSTIEIAVVSIIILAWVCVTFAYGISRARLENSKKGGIA